MSWINIFLKITFPLSFSFISIFFIMLFPQLQNLFFVFFIFFLRLARTSVVYLEWYVFLYKYFFYPVFFLTSFLVSSVISILIYCRLYWVSKELSELLSKKCLILFKELTTENFRRTAFPFGSWKPLVSWLWESNKNMKRSIQIKLLKMSYWNTETATSKNCTITLFRNTVVSKISE